MGQQQIQISVDSYLLTIQLLKSRYSSDQKALQIYAQNIDADAKKDNLQATYNYQQLPGSIKKEFKSINNLFQYLVKITSSSISCCMRQNHSNKQIKIQKQQLCFFKKGEQYRLKLNSIQSNHQSSLFDDNLKQNQKTSKISIEERLQNELKKKKLEVDKKQKQKNTHYFNHEQKTNNFATNDEISYQSTLNNSKKKFSIAQINLSKYLIFFNFNQKLLNLRQNNTYLKQLLTKRTSNEKQQNYLSFINAVNLNQITSLDLFDNSLNNEDLNFIFRSITENNFDKSNLQNTKEQLWKGLKKLWLDKNKISAIKDSFLSYFSQKLQVFSLSENQLGQSAISKIFCNRFKWPFLKILKISCKLFVNKVVSSQIESCFKIIIDYLINLRFFCMPQTSKIIITNVSKQNIQKQTTKSLFQKLKFCKSVQKVSIACGGDLNEKQYQKQININYGKENAIIFYIKSDKKNQIEKDLNSQNKINYPSMYQSQD